MQNVKKHLELLGHTVMDKPDYDFGFVAEGKHGPAEKTMRHKW